MSGTAKFSLQFPKQVAITLLVVSVLISYPLFRYASEEILHAVVGGVVLSLVNVLMGYAAIEYSFDKSYTQFIQIVMGGIVIRLFVMIGLLLLLVLVFQFHVLALVGSLFALYVIFLALEVLYIHNKWQKKIDIQNL